MHHSIQRMTDIKYLTVTATRHDGIGTSSVTNNGNVHGLTQSGKEVRKIMHNYNLITQSL